LDSQRSNLSFDWTLEISFLFLGIN
jgi:hypothetical protein